MSGSERNKTECFSTILHRLLCTGSCQTHPSDHISETDHKKSLNCQKEDPDSSKVQIKEQHTPGIVARLMGLESLPEINWVSKRDKNADFSICRSRSVNSVQCLLEFDLSEALHRRLRTSVSFRELLMLPQNSHGSLLNHETKDLGLKDYETGHFEVDAERRINKENVREGMVGKRCNGGKNKKCSKKNEESSKIYPKASSEARNFRRSAKDLVFANSRSVMASKVEKPVKHGNKKKDPIDVTALPGKRRCRHADKKVEGRSRSKVLDPRRNRSPKMVSYDYPSPNLAHVSNRTNQYLKNNEHKLMIKNKDYHLKESQYHAKLLGEVCKLTEEHMNGASWITDKARKSDYFEEVCIEFGQHILDLLLHQVVDELVQVNCKR